MQPAQPPRVPTRAARYPDAGADVEGWQTPPAYAAAARASPRVSTSEAIPTTTDRRCCRRGKRTPTPNCQQWVLTWSAAVLVASVAVYGFLWLRGGSLTYASLVGNLHAGTAAPIDSQVLHVAMDDVRLCVRSMGCMVPRHGVVGGHWQLPGHPVRWHVDQRYGQLAPD